MFYRVMHYKLSGWKHPHIHIHNCINAHHALLKFLAYCIEEAAKDDVDICVFLGDYGFELKYSDLIDRDDLQPSKDTIRIE